jgi:predicted RNase H-like HicB family nuclease
MKEIVFKIEEDIIDGGYIAEAYTTDNEHIITQGETIDELKSMIKDALECHFENPLEMPHRVIMQFIRQEVFAF